MALWLRVSGRARMVRVGDKGGRVAAPMVGITMSRVIAILACGFALAACSMSMPSLDFFKSAPATETLRVESEPPGADARTTQGQSCRTPCELVVTSGAELAVSFALNGYQPTTLQVRPDSPPSAYGETGPARLQPNPVYAELVPLKPAPAKRKPAAKKKQFVQKGAPAQQQQPAQSGAADPNAAYPAGYPWPDPVPAR
jgi:hypothetical protein